MYNAALSKISDTIDPSCRFCLFRKTLPCNREILEHLGHCENLRYLFITIIQEQFFSYPISNKNIFLGYPDGTKNESIIFNVYTCIFFNVVFKNKTLNINNLKNIERQIKVDFMACRDASNKLDSICSFMFNQNPGWSFLKKNDVFNG